MSLTRRSAAGLSPTRMTSGASLAGLRDAGEDGIHLLPLRGDDELGRTAHEPGEGFEVPRGRAEVIEMNRIDVRDDRDGGVVEQEGPVGLVGLEHEEFVGSGCRARRQRLDDAAVDETRVDPELLAES